MQTIRSLIEMAALGIESLAVGVILIATAHGTVSYLLHLRDKIPDAYERYKVRLGRALLLGLELLVAADIIRTVALEPTLANVMTLAVLVVVRTFLSWSLVVEIEGHWPWKSDLKDMTNPSAHPLDVGTRLAVDRTRLAHERTLMAWVRTATSLISFGFTIYKFFEFELKGQPPGPEPLIGPRGFALFMIGIGLVALLLSTLEHRRSMHAMRTEFGTVPVSTAAVVAGLIALLGFGAFVAVVFRS